MNMNDESSGGKSEATDYSKTSSWFKIPEITKDIDTFFVYPTEYMGDAEGDSAYAAIDNPDMVEGVTVNYPIMGSVYEDSTNVFMPFYRQASVITLGNAADSTGDFRSALASIPYGDVTAALDYYFKNYNGGRPFIIAGHSQGSAIVTLVLKDYFKEHPEYYERMVAAYVIGFSVTKEYLEDNPHLKFATGEDDAGVIISWNTEGKENVETGARNVVVLPNEISINPLNWKLDGTYAPASENLGSLMVDEMTSEISFGDIGADAQLVLGRGVILTNADAEPLGLPQYFGPQSFHNSDYTFYYNNIKENVAKRIATYLGS